MTEDVVDEMTVIEFFGSIQSPYCYFALDRLEAMARELNLRILMRPVLPSSFSSSIVSLEPPILLAMIIFSIDCASTATRPNASGSIDDDMIISETL